MIHRHLHRYQHHHHRPTLSKVSWAEGKIYIWGSLTGPIIYYFPWSRSQVRVDFEIAEHSYLTLKLLIRSLVDFFGTILRPRFSFKRGLAVHVVRRSSILVWSSVS